MSEETASFVTAFRGSFVGILRWHQLDDFWSVLRKTAGQGWYIYPVGEIPPVSVATEQQVLTFIDEIGQLLRADHQYDYCGIVYVDDKDNPSFVKIFDPNNLGVSCGSSDNPPLPGWIISKLRPVDLPNALPQTGSRRGWWQRIFGG